VRRQAERDAAFAWPVIASRRTKAPSALRSAGALQKLALCVLFNVPMLVQSWRLKLSLSLNVLPASCRQMRLGPADETSAARCRRRTFPRAPTWLTTLPCGIIKLWRLFMNQTMKELNLAIPIFP
jgi:hypothetical protein